MNTMEGCLCVCVSVYHINSSLHGRFFLREGSEIFVCNFIQALLVLCIHL